MLLFLLESKEQTLAKVESMNSTLLYLNFCGLAYLGWRQQTGPSKKTFVTKCFGTIESWIIYRDIFVTHCDNDDSGDYRSPNHSNYYHHDTKPQRKFSG